MQRGQVDSQSEDITVGAVFTHPVGRTMTETVNAWLTLLAMDSSQDAAPVERVILRQAAVQRGAGFLKGFKAVDS